MNNEVVLSFDNVSKKFCRNFKRSLFYGVQDVMGELFCLDKNRDRLRNQEFWALKNVTFEIKKGESIGIVGHNGAGKTTSLKMINGLIKPNTGRIEVKGRVGALIALGAGFNPVLTGRENIRVAGAMLGYTREEVRKKEQEIINFSEIHDFIDSPVQSYSSGMMARLGFAVAIHTDPDVLLVDEVLAVGDLNFVIKCFKKIFEFQKRGGSMLLVSHNMYSIRANCSRVLWIEKGEMKMFGDTNTVCDAYESYVSQHTTNQIDGEVFSDKDINVSGLNYAKEHQLGQDFEIDFLVESEQEILKPIFCISLFTLTGVNITSTVYELENTFLGKKKVSLKFKALSINPGTYTLNMVIASGNINNQLFASVNQNKFSVIGTINKFGVGIIDVENMWDMADLKH